MESTRSGTPAQKRWTPSCSISHQMALWRCPAVRRLDFTTVDYLVARSRARRAAATAVSDLLQLLPVVPLETADFQHALLLGLADYEDAVQAAVSLKIGANDLVTRNEKHFREAPISVRSPGEVLALLQ